MAEESTELKLCIVNELSAKLRFFPVIVTFVSLLPSFCADVWAGEAPTDTLICASTSRMDNNFSGAGKSEQMELFICSNWLSNAFTFSDLSFNLLHETSSPTWFPSATCFDPSSSQHPSPGILGVKNCNE